jgi:hypothetical protein
MLTGSLSRGHTAVVVFFAHIAEQLAFRLNSRHNHCPTRVLRGILQLQRYLRDQAISICYTQLFLRKSEPLPGGNRTTVAHLGIKFATMNPVAISSYSRCRQLRLQRHHSKSSE